MSDQISEIELIRRELHGTRDIKILERTLQAIIAISDGIKRKFEDYDDCITYHTLISSTPRIESMSSSDEAVGEEILTELRRVRQEILGR
jgi:hypothetical protein